MTRKGWPIGCWELLRAWTRLATGNPRGRRRKLRISSFTPIAAGVEQLESRQLLTVTFHGGALLQHVEAQAVYLGSDWKNTASLQAQAGQIDQFVSTIVQSQYMDMLTNAGYNVGRGTATAGILDGIAVNKTTGITDLQIQSDIQSLLTSGQLQGPDANRLYIVYVEPGVVVHLGSDASNTTFLGYHGAFAGTNVSGVPVDVHYAVIPYPGAPNFSAASQGFTSNFNEMSSVTSHELAEAVTDPNVNYKALGWYDDQNNGEIGDLTNINTLFDNYIVQDVVNQNDQPISPSSVTPPPPPPSGLTAPSVTAAALSSTVAQLSWGAVSGTQGYRIYQVIGSQSVLLGTLGASTTSVQVTGLTPGSQASFKVEAFNATATADSQVVSVTMPGSSMPQGLASPRLAATALSPTSALLHWSSVWGAQGYRVYMSQGGQRVLLGTVSSWATSVQIVGLTPGTTAQFLVEAFRGGLVGDSAWVSVRTPAASAHDPASLWAALAVHANHAKHDDSQWLV